MNKMSIEIVSDVMCPWCAIGYKNLEIALQALGNDIDADISWHAFELNPDMSVAGQNLREHLMEKYGITPEQSDANRERISVMGEQAGFTFNFADDGIMINSFDCHRLLTWAKGQGKQTDLKLALFQAHFTDNKRLNDAETLLDVVASVGLDRATAAAVLDSDEFAQEVRDEQRRMHRMGIQSVPTFIINQKYAINGGQPADVFKEALQQIQQEQTSSV
ncbi:DsbA family oxidoreductase [Reinekea sp. G2M2-21]|uniref:DsbA family oxidoreductase n=1 Tax=Reinekea sp. G2M2-21 TaxID=2788942 RepID=UPI0018A93C41|nr:DsbA family oxidoreductase [Reinekea sp. G2M2-21]